MATEMSHICPDKTYASEQNARKAVESLQLPVEVRYMIVYNKSGRCYPVFVGQSAMQYQLWFKGFICVA